MEVKVKRKITHTLVFEDGTEVPVSRLGRGQWSTVWRNGSHAYSITKSGDIGKEAISWFCSESDNPHIPVIERVGMSGDDYVYKMPVYEKLTAKHKDAWEQFRLLEKYRDEAWREVLSSPNKLAGLRWLEDGYLIAQRTIEKYREDKNHVPEIADAMQEILDAGMNFGSSCCFEFAKRNLAIDDHSRLVLLDILYDLKEVVGK